MMWNIVKMKMGLRFYIRLGMMKTSGKINELKLQIHTQMGTIISSLVLLMDLKTEILLFGKTTD